VSDEHRSSLRVPLDWVIVDALGAVLTGAGVYGLLREPSGPLPVLSEPGVAWLCIAFGVGMMAFAIMQIFKRVLRQLGERSRDRS